MIGLIAFANPGGLGIQTKRLYEMLKPCKVMIVDSTGFSKNKQLNLDWYPEDSMVTNGFPRNCEINEWLDGLTSVLTVENPYNFYLIHTCRERGIRTFVQTNYEFCENVFAPHLPVPDVFLMPSYWKLEEMKEMFPGRVIYLPPPIDPAEFKDIKQHFVHDGKFLHIVGTLAHEDRNGTLDLLEAVKLAKKDFKLTIHSQHNLPDEYIIDDPRVTYRIKNFDKNSDLYLGHKALILPRRYGGLSLTTNEALMSGMPVMMTDISPNNKFLPKEWLVEVEKRDPVFIRMKIDTYSANHQDLANKLDEWTEHIPGAHMAKVIAHEALSSRVLRDRYKQLLLV